MFQQFSTAVNCDISTVEDSIDGPQTEIVKGFDVEVRLNQNKPMETLHYTKG